MEMTTCAIFTRGGDEEVRNVPDYHTVKMISEAMACISDIGEIRKPPLIMENKCCTEHRVEVQPHH